jgi:hypothetical protein
VSFNDRFENLTIPDVLSIEIPEIGNAHAGKAHKTKEVSCPGPLGRFELKIQQLKALLSQPLQVISEGIRITQQDDYQRQGRSSNWTDPLPAIGIFDFFLILVRA